MRFAQGAKINEVSAYANSYRIWFESYKKMFSFLQVTTPKGSVGTGSGSSVLPTITNAQGQPVSANALGQSSNNVQSKY